MRDFSAGRLSGMFWVSLALMVACGCATTREKQLEMQVRQQESVLDALRKENSQLKGESERLRSELEAAQAGDRALEQDREEMERRLAGLGLKVAVREGRLAVLLPSKVVFQPGRAALSSSGKTSLSKVADLLKKEFAGKVIRIEGHTDSTPIKKSGYRHNLELSNHRAESVWDYLTKSCGIDPKSCYTAGFGEYRPVASNATEDGKQQNRRVELLVIQE